MPAFVHCCFEKRFALLWWSEGPLMFVPKLGVFWMQCIVLKKGKNEEGSRSIAFKSRQEWNSCIFGGATPILKWKRETRTMVLGFCPASLNWEYSILHTSDMPSRVFFDQLNYRVCCPIPFFYKFNSFKTSFRQMKNLFWLNLNIKHLSIFTPVIWLSSFLHKVFQGKRCT